MKQNKFPAAGVALGVVLIVCAITAGFFILNSYKDAISIAMDTPAKTISPELATTAPAQATISPAESERALAEWLIKQPGVSYLVLAREDGALVPPLETGGILPDGEFYVGRIDWMEADAITNDDLERIGNASRLNSLTLSAKEGKFPNVTDLGLDKLFSPPLSKKLGVIQFNATFPKVSEEGYLAINRARNLSALHYWRFQPGKGKFFSQLNLPRLTELVVLGEDIPAGWLETLTGQSPDLTQLTVTGCQLTQSELKTLTRNDLWSRLSLVNCKITDESLDTIAELKRLTTLCLDGNPEITDQGAVKIASLKELQSLARFNDCNVGDETCKTLASLSKLIWIGLGGTRVTDKGIDVLTSLKSLERLELHGCKRLTDQVLESLAKISSLTELSITNNPQLTEPAIRKLHNALPKCKVVSDFGIFEPTQN